VPKRAPALGARQELHRDEPGRAVHGVVMLPLADHVGWIHLGADALARAQAEWASTFVERRPIRQIEHFARPAADHISPHAYFARLASEPEREVSPPPGVEGEEVRAELRREPLDELDARADVVARGPRERQARKSAEPDDVERRAIADVRDGARVTEQ